MNTLKVEKDRMREIFKKKRIEMDRELKRKRDEKICKSALSLASYRYAEYVLMYASSEDEINIMPIAADAIKRGKKVAFPKCNTADHTMKYHIVSSLDDLSVQSYGLREPYEGLPVYNQEEMPGEAICFVPALVFDKKGYCLGYGKGFYDRYLSSFKGSIIGVVYNDFIMPSVPKGRYDVSIRVLLTDKGIRITDEN